LHFLSFRFVDSKEIDKLSFFFPNIVKDVLIKEQFSVEIIFVVAAEFNDSINSILGLARF
jgi:hypothetical protein